MNIAERLMNGVMPSSVSNDKHGGPFINGEQSLPLFRKMLSIEQSIYDDSFDRHNEIPAGWLGGPYQMLIDQQATVDQVSNLKISANVRLFLHELHHEGLTQSNAGQIMADSPIELTDKQLELVQQDQVLLITQFNEIFAKAESLLNELGSISDISKVSPMILKLLEQWTTLDQKYHDETILSRVFQGSMEQQNDAHKLWGDLVNAYKQRNGLMANHFYESQAKVTVKDVSKWLQSYLPIEDKAGTQIHSQQVNILNQPLSVVEQYVIYINQSEPAEKTSKQLVNQFEQVIRTSRFLSLNNGVNQLSIALRPDNLGEMMVRLTEINGEMTLKIIVSSQATRQMLESNIHQLKHMFSPHQVVIEERVGMPEDVQGSHEEQDQPFDEGEQSHQSDQDEAGTFRENNEVSFHEIFMNEKV